MNLNIPVVGAGLYESQSGLIFLASIGKTDNGLAWKLPPPL